MKRISTVSRYLLGAMFVVFGLNGLAHLIKQPPPVNPLAQQFLVAIEASHFSAFLFAVQLVAGFLLLVDLYVPVGLILLAAEIYNILAFHLTLEPGTGILPGLLASVLWIAVFARYRQSFDCIFRVRPLKGVETLD